MKILILTTAYTSSSSGHHDFTCQQLRRCMEERGHVVRVLCTPPDGPTDEAVVTTLRPTVRTGNKLNLMALWEIERQNNRLVREELERFGPDVVYICELEAVSLSLAHTVERSGVPVVYSVGSHWLTRAAKEDPWQRWWSRDEGSVTQQMSRGLLRAIGTHRRVDDEAPTARASELAMRRAIFSSTYLHRQATWAGLPVESASIIPYGIDAERFTQRVSRTRYRCAHLLFVGPIAPDHGVSLVIRALNRIQASFGGSLTLCGKGDPSFEKAIRQIVEARKLPVRFVDVPREQMPELYAQHDALIYHPAADAPSAPEAFEAIASGMAVICPGDGLCGEIFRDGENASVYGRDDENALARRILGLYNFPHIAGQLAKNAHAEMGYELSQEIAMDRVEQYLWETVATWEREERIGGDPLRSGGLASA